VRLFASTQGNQLEPGTVSLRDYRIAGSAEVARLAGVSRSAVSRTFTPGAYVSAETRSKVLAAAEMLGYRPNAIARSLSTRQSKLVGIAASNLDNPFYAQMLAILSKLLQQRGFGILLLVAEPAEIDGLIRQMLSYQVDGVILPAATLGSKIAIDLQRFGRPVVLVNRYLAHDVISSVSGDNIGGGARVADLFAQAGRRRIAFLAGQPDTSSSRDRGRGFREQLASYGIGVYAEDAGQYAHREGAAAARRLLSRTPHPDAIFCANDSMALAALEVARTEFNLRVPEDVAVVGYDNSAAASWPFYELTSVDQNLPQMAQIAVDLLVSKIEGKSAGIDHMVVPATLVERATTPATAVPPDVLLTARQSGP
jgi:DNA-binding LacI/PurR family transcriptional regulator